MSEPTKAEVQELVAAGYTDCRLGAYYGRGDIWANRIRRRYGIKAVPRGISSRNRMAGNMAYERQGERGVIVPTDEQTRAWHKGYRFDQGRAG